MPAKLLNLLAVSSLAILACSFGAAPANALSIESHEVFPRAHAHAALVHKKRTTSGKRCKPRSTPAPGGTNKAPTSKPPAAPKTSSTQAAPSTSSSPAPNNGGGNGSKKVGLGWANDDNAALKRFVTPNVGPIMTWSPWIPDISKSLGLTPCPMLWGPKQIPQFQQLVKPGYANVVLGFNEPNQQGQSDMDPGYAAQLWKQYIQPLKAQGYSLITPACTNAPSGIPWLKSFMAACTGCTFDGLAFHFYGTSSQDMINYMQDLHSTFNLPIWATEFACQNFAGGAQCSKDEVWNFMSTVKSFMDSTPWIAHYFAFGALYNMGNVNPLNQLLGGNGYPTDLGYFYIN